MRRHIGLRLLSVDHHHALVHAARMQADLTEETVEKTAAAFLDLWNNETCRHFREEEEILLPIFARDGGDISGEAISQMLTDHIRIRAAVLAIEAQRREGRVDPETIRRAGAVLEAHVRLEERIVFPLIQDNLNEPALQEIGADLAMDHETAGGASCAATVGTGSAGRLEESTDGD